MTQRWVWMLVCILCGAAAWSAPPTCSRIFPPGGQHGQTVRVAIDGQYDTSNVRVWCSRAGLRWVPTGEEQAWDVEIDAEVPPGVVWVRLHNDEGVSELRPFLVGHLPEAREEEPNDIPRQTTAAGQDPLIAYGVLEQRGDADCYGLRVQAGQTLVAAVTAHEELESPVDVTLQIVTRDGHVLAQNLDYHGLDPLVTWTADADRKVWVRVFGYPAAPNSTIALAGAANYLYRLTATTGPYLEGSWPLAVPLDGDQSVEPRGWNLPTTAESLQIDIDASTNSASLFHSQMAGVIELPETSTPLVTINHREREEPETDSPQPTTIPHERATSVSLPVIATGELDRAGVTHHFDFSATPETRWRIAVESRSLGYPTDPVLVIRDRDSGKVLQREDDTGRRSDPSVVWQAPSAGRYRISVADVNGHGGELWLYRLRIEPERPECKLSVATDVIRGKVGETVELPVQVERRGGFSEAVTFAVRSMPEGLELAPAVSPAEGDLSKQVTLKLKSNRPLCLPISVAGHTEAGEVFPVMQPQELTVVWIVIEAAPETASENS